MAHIETRAPAELKSAWYSKSGIIPCDRCEGEGSFWNGRGYGGNDPDSWSIECEDCDGVGHHACGVCGFDIEIPGVDCLACDLVREIPEALLSDQTADALATAVKASIAYARAHHERINRALEAREAA
jgi:Ribonuclease G/E